MTQVSSAAAWRCFIARPAALGTSDGGADIDSMHWLYYVGLAVAVVALLNILLVVYLAIATREPD